jgi:hypothetical protein
VATSIIDKIRKLRELSKSDNVNEAATAARMADKLIAEHRISEAELNIAEGSNEKPIEDTGVLYESARVIQWKSGLACRLAAHYSCAVWNDQARSKTLDLNTGMYSYGNRVSRYRLVGLKSDIEIVNYMFAWLSTEIERLAKKNACGRGMVYRQSYCLGAVSGIREQLRLQKEETRASAQASGHSTALVKLDERAKEADITMNTLHPHLSKERKSSNQGGFDNGAFGAGKEAGKNIHLGKALSGQSNKLLT